MTVFRTIDFSEGENHLGLFETLSLSLPVSLSVSLPVCLYLLHLLPVSLSCSLAGDSLLNKLPWRSDFLVGVGSQEDALIEVSRRQNVLLVLLVYGFTEDTRNAQHRQGNAAPNAAENNKN